MFSTGTMWLFVLPLEQEQLSNQSRLQPVHYTSHFCLCSEVFAEVYKKGLSSVAAIYTDDYAESWK